MTAPSSRQDPDPGHAQDRRASELHARSAVVDLAPAPLDGLDDAPTSPASFRIDLEPSSLASTRRSLEERPDLLIAETAGDVRTAVREHRRIVSLGIRTASGLTDVEPLHAHGLRIVGFSPDPTAAPADVPLSTAGVGLTAHGDRLLRRIDQLEIVVDVADCDRATAFDIAMRSAHPVVTSRVPFAEPHGAGSGLGPDELRAIASTDGAIGVGLDPRPPGSSVARGPSDGRTSITALLDRIDAVAALVGSRYVALGIGGALPAGPGHEALTHGLVARGYTDDEILGILGENALRVFAAVWG